MFASTCDVYPYYAYNKFIRNASWTRIMRIDPLRCEHNIYSGYGVVVIEKLYQIKNKTSK